MMRHNVLAILLATLSSVNAWLPMDRGLFETSISIGKGRSVMRSLYSGKIRGVNLGSLFIIEPWMASQEWDSMGCSGSQSEFDCVMKLGQDQANSAFRKHWDSWITAQDLDRMKEYGLNTIRIPVGYWIVESTVYRDSEHFPQGGLEYLDRLAGWAADRGMYVILDLHGGPGAQEARQPFTGQYAPEAGFFQGYQFDRAYTFLQTMTQRIHQNAAYRTTGMIEVINEPARGHSNLISEFYPTAYDKIRQVESSLGIEGNSQLTIQFMDAAWGAGSPRDGIGGRTNVAFDDHRYLKWAPIEQSKASYLATSCKDSFGEGNDALIVGEWSLSVDTAVEWTPEWDPTKEENKGFYRQWWGAQVQAYEKRNGWIFWSWKTQLGGDWRWSYSAAVDAGVIPRNPDEASGLARC